jgi:hypothetical protein
MKKSIKELDALRALLGIWEKTCVHPCQMNLQRFITEDTPELKSMAPRFASVCVRERLVIPDGWARTRRYRWNKEAGPPTYVMAQRILLLTRQLNAEYSRTTYHRKKENKL